MPDNIDINTSTTATTIPVATLDVGGIQHEKVIVEHLVGGIPVMTDPDNPLPVIAALPVGAATAANQQTDALTDAELRATPVPVSIDASLLATGAKQDTQTALLTTLNSLIENLNSLVNVLMPLGGAMNSGAPGLRVTPNAATLPISGSVTATVASTVVSSLTNFGTGIPAKEMADDINNFTVTLANINNVTP